MNSMLTRCSCYVPKIFIADNRQGHKSQLHVSNSTIDQPSFLERTAAILSLMGAIPVHYRLCFE